MVSDKSPLNGYKYKQNIAVALSGSLISTAPRVFKDRRAGGGEETRVEKKTPAPARYFQDDLDAALLIHSALFIRMELSESRSLLLQEGGGGGGAV